MDYKKLTSVHTQISDAEKKERQERIAARRKKIKDFIDKRKREAQKDADQRVRTADSLERRKKAIAARRAADAKRRAEIIAKRKADSQNKKPTRKTHTGRPKTYQSIKDSSNYKRLIKKIKDELSETESTEEAIDVALEALQEAPAEQVLAATVEVLGEAIDSIEELYGDLEDPDDYLDPDDDPMPA
jgi:HSP90 family molecular chaperone